MPERWSAFDLAEAFQLSQAVNALHDSGLLAALRKPAAAEELAEKFGLDEALLRGVLEYVAARTDLLRKSGKKFAATREYEGASRFVLDLYVGAYGPNASRLKELLRDPSNAPKAVDRVLHARAFDAAEGPPLGILPELIRRLDLNHLLDLGCGNAALLAELAQKDPAFVGWGLELNPSMRKVARSRLRAASLGKRVRVLKGDCTQLGSALPLDVAAAVRAVTACNVANELFADGHARAVEWLRDLRKLLPKRPLLLVDYYGRLGQKKPDASRETLLHDYAQLISGQGIPPSDAARWRAIYTRAGCRLLHIIEDQSTTRFIHILRL